MSDFDTTEMKKYQVMLPLQYGPQVAATCPEDAIAVHFPPDEYDYEEHSSGRGWKRFEFEEELPEGWPTHEDGVDDGGGNIIDVEEVGDITVVLPHDSQ